MVKYLCDETDEETISAFLSYAADVLYEYGDPYKTMTLEEFVEQYGSAQVKAAAYYINKRGWDFETEHVENGMTRKYGANDLPADIIGKIPQRGCVPK